MMVARKLAFTLVPIMVYLAPVACIRMKVPAQASPVPRASPTPASAAKNHAAALALPSLARKFAADFDIGAAVEPSQTRDMADILAHHFGRLTAENQMKMGPLCQQPACNFAQADEIADFARQHGLKITGHTFVWHQMVPGWIFKAHGKDASREQVEERLKGHIFTLTKRYADVVDNWDVVNEAISDSPGKTYRDHTEGSPWFKAFGGTDYIEAAFTHAAAAAAQHDPTVKLYYNDYNVVIPEKRAKIIEMIRWLRGLGVRVDGVGMQGHWNIEWPTVAEIATAIDELAAENLEVKVSELDVSLYSKDDHATKKWQAELEYTPELEARLTARYAEIFRVLRQKSALLSHVTFWGISDDHSWLNSWPSSRKNHPLLFDREHQPKPALRALLEL
jgi:endo-1,4-beta-xylanase